MWPLTDDVAEFLTSLFNNKTENMSRSSGACFDDKKAIFRINLIYFLFIAAV